MFRKAALWAVLALASALPGLAIGQDDAIAAYQRGDDSLARSLAEPRALGGDHTAQTLLGLLYWRGRGVARDDRLAFEWMSKAAAQSNAEALTHLGRMLEEGEGAPKDEAKAYDAYLRAAELGHADAQFRVGQAYHYGRGVRRDGIRARYWYERADRAQWNAEGGDRVAQQASLEPKAKLPDACVPRRPPIATMNRLGATRASGTLTFALDRQGRVRGVVEQTLSEPELRFDVVAYFSESLRSQDCVWDERLRGRWYVVPFTLEVTR
ncbi:MAG: sel1 repeat family protein [Burkholderiales bacterium]|nr:sel1 repeat family protein [Burkholderiales bacterium]